MHRSFEIFIRYFTPYELVYGPAKRLVPTSISSTSIFLQHNAQEQSTREASDRRRFNDADASTSKTEIETVKTRMLSL
jgi:hypothetical protein